MRPSCPSRTVRLLSFRRPRFGGGRCWGGCYAWPVCARGRGLCCRVWRRVVSIVLSFDLDAEARGNRDGGRIWARPQASSARRIVHPTNSCPLTSHPSIQSTCPARKPTNSPRRAHYEGRYSRRCLRMALLVGTTQNFLTR
jgi:hypothetical protein